jgi:putative membrane protein
MWIPPAMMSVIGVLVVLNALRLNEDANVFEDEASSALAARASSWTGR